MVDHGVHPTRAIGMLMPYWSASSVITQPALTPSATWSMEAIAADKEVLPTASERNCSERPSAAVTYSSNLDQIQENGLFRTGRAWIAHLSRIILDERC